ncbi:serine protease [Desulfobacterales bacterium HSG16]|nr:serine protease [Desulfobacterales bacterium HSG16]
MTEKISKSNPNHALVRILYDNEQRHSNGAGFLADKKHIITCAHVVDGCIHDENDEKIVYVDFPLIRGNPMIETRLILRREPVSDPTVEQTSDIAILEILPRAQLPDMACPAILKDVGEMEIFDHPVRICGFPEYMEHGDWIDGRLKGETGQGIQINHKLTSGKGAPGFSGAPVWNKDKFCVGMVTRITKREDTVSTYMIPAKYLSHFLKFHPQCKIREK